MEKSQVYRAVFERLDRFPLPERSELATEIFEIIDLVESAELELRREPPPDIFALIDKWVSMANDAADGRTSAWIQIANEAAETIEFLEGASASMPHGAPKLTKLAEMKNEALERLDRALAKSRQLASEELRRIKRR